MRAPLSNERCSRRAPVLMNTDERLSTLSKDQLLSARRFGRSQLNQGVRWRVKHFSNFLACAVASISIGGCHHVAPVPEPLRVEDVRSTARSAIVGLNRDTLRVDVTVLNTAKTPRALGTWACGGNPLAIKVQRDGRTWDSGAWERERMQQPVVRDSTGKVIPQVFTCSAMMVRELQPGRSVLAYSSSTPVREVLGDSLPPGRYQIRAFFSLNRHSIEGVSAGEVELRAPPT
jgi:hypothetical protein